jgi:hypothetical protein
MILMRTTTKIEGFRNRQHWAVLRGSSGDWYLAYARPTQYGLRYDPGVGSFRIKREAVEAKRQINTGDLDPTTLKPRS